MLYPILFALLTLISKLKIRKIENEPINFQRGLKLCNIDENRTVDIEEQASSFETVHFMLYEYCHHSYSKRIVKYGMIELCVQMLFISSGYHSFFFCAVIFGMFIFYLHSNTEEEKLDSHYYEFLNCGWGYRYLHQNKYLVRNYILHFIMNTRHNLSISFFFLGWIHNVITMTLFYPFVSTIWFAWSVSPTPIYGSTSLIL